MSAVLVCLGAPMRRLNACTITCNRKHILAMVKSAHKNTRSKLNDTYNKFKKLDLVLCVVCKDCLCPCVRSVLEDKFFPDPGWSASLAVPPAFDSPDFAEALGHLMKLYWPWKTWASQDVRSRLTLVNCCNAYCFATVGHHRMYHCYIVTTALHQLMIPDWDGSLCMAIAWTKLWLKKLQP